MTNITKRKIKLYSDQIVAATFVKNDKDNTDIDSIFRLLRPYIIIDVDFLSMQHEKRTKKHIIMDKSIGNMEFRIDKKTAKRIKLYPYNKRKYRVTFKIMYDIDKFKSKVSNRISNPNHIGLKKRTIHFTSIHHKDVKKFELPKLLTLAYKLDPTIFLKIEKLLFEKTG